MLTDVDILRIKHAAWDWPHPGGGAATVLATQRTGVLLAVVMGKRSVTLELVEPLPARGVHDCLDLAASLLARPRRDAGEGRGPAAAGTGRPVPLIPLDGIGRG